MPASAIKHRRHLCRIDNRQPREHRFWDRQNKLLVATGAAGHGADFALTLSNLVTLGYFRRKSGPQLERLVTVVNLGAFAGAVS